LEYSFVQNWRVQEKNEETSSWVEKARHAKIKRGKIEKVARRTLKKNERELSFEEEWRNAEDFSYEKNHY